jgi:methionyl aminopeptidase
MTGRIARRTPEELAAMRRAGRVVAEMHDVIRAAIAPGVATAELDEIGRRVLERRGATSNFLGYHGYPAVICTSPNHAIVHGIPGPYRLTEGDIVSIDCGAIVDGWHGDAAFTSGVGEITASARRLIDVTESALAAGIAAALVDNHIGDIGHAVQEVAERAGFSVVREYTGHGIGRAMHEPPDIPNYGKRGTGARLVAGNTLAIEPMVCAGGFETVELDDGWTVITSDGELAAHAEHTIVVTDDGPEILTRV